MNGVHKSDEIAGLHHSNTEEGERKPALGVPTTGREGQRAALTATKGETEGCPYSY